MKHPLKLVIVADDLTGAFDTGVQFQKRGACVVFTTLEHLTMCSTDADVVVIDTESRHDQPAKAYEKTARAVYWAQEQGAAHLYIKTDSGLRGNIGSMLKAAMDTLGCRVAAFAPAYPEMKRITVQGRHLIDGIPVHRSVFGRDPFDPVTTDVIKDMLEPSGVRVIQMLPCDIVESADEAGVWSFDAQTNEDLATIAAQLARHAQLRLTAGCAAFADTLYEHLGLPVYPVGKVVCNAPLLVVCGSINTITRKQILNGQSQGYSRYIISPSLLCDDGFWFGDGGVAWRNMVCQAVLQCKTVLIDTGFDVKPVYTSKREIIAARLGGLMYELLKKAWHSTLMPMIIGGDTLKGFLACLEHPDIRLEGALDGGVVAFSTLINERRQRMLSKSGGFGHETLLKDLTESMR